MCKAATAKVVDLQLKKFEDLSKIEKLDLVKKLKKHLSDLASVDVDTGCWEPFKSGEGTNLCINNNDSGRVILNFSGFLRTNGVFLAKNSTAVAQAFFKLLDVENKKYNASHLCHNPKCMNPEHLVYEDAEYNRSRNYCVGDQGCLHEPKCLKEGVRFHIIKNKKDHFNVSL